MTSTGTRIVHISDLHLEPEAGEQYPGSRRRLDRIHGVIADLNADLVVATGDLTNKGSSHPEEFQIAKDWLDRLGADYLAVAGNHDLGANERRGPLSNGMEQYDPRAFSLTPYADAFGAAPVSRATAGDLTALGIALREDDPDDALDQLDSALSMTPGPVVVAGHYPAVETRTWPEPYDFGSRGYIDNTAPRLESILRHHRNVIAYLCGHVHLTSLRSIGEHCRQFTACALGPGPSAFRVYDWDGTRWTYATHDTEGPQVFWENFSDFARADPLFSCGMPDESAGSWMPLQARG